MSEGGHLTTQIERTTCLVGAKHQHVAIGLLTLLYHVVLRQLGEFIADFFEQLGNEDLEH